MSTKIHFGYRFPMERMNDFLAHVRAHNVAMVKEEFIREMSFIKDEELENKINEEEMKLWGFDLERYKLWLRYKEVSKTFKHDARHHRSCLIECGWSFWFHGGYVYSIPWGFPYTYQTIKMPDWVEEYGYWNDTDERPKGVTDAEWEERRRTWLEIIDPLDWSGCRVTHTTIDVLDVNRTYFTLLREIEQEIRNGTLKLVDVNINNELLEKIAKNMLERIEQQRKRDAALEIRLDQSYEGHLLSQGSDDPAQVLSDLVDQLAHFSEVLPNIKDEVQALSQAATEAIEQDNYGIIEHLLYDRVIPLLNRIAPPETEVAVPAGRESIICFTSNPTNFDVHFAITGFHTISGISEDHVKHCMNAMIDEVIDDVERLLCTGVKDDDYVTDVVRV